MFKHLLTQPTGDPNVEIDNNLGGNYGRLFMAVYRLSCAMHGVGRIALRLEPECDPFLPIAFFGDGQ